MRCKCGSIIVGQPYKIGQSQVCEGCYARYVRDGAEPEVDRIERERVRKSEQGPSGRCKECGGLFKKSILVNGFCGQCSDVPGDDA